MTRILAVLVLFTSVLQVSAQDAGPKKTAQHLGIEEYEMPNGLRVVLFRDPTAPKVTVNLTVLVGSVHEGAGEAGMAHVFEHMLFHSLEGFPDVSVALKDLGASYNGTTWFDRTNYFETVTATDANLETAIHLESSRLGRAKLEAQDLVSEGKIVESEFDIAASNPQRLVLMGMFGAMFDFHAYSRNPIGTIEDFQSLNVESIRKFYVKYYRPDNALLVVTGKFETERVLELVGKHFGDLKGTGEGRPVYTTREPASVGERRYTVRKPGEAHVVVVGYRIPGTAHPDSAVADLLARMLASGKTGPLYEGVVSKGLAGDVSADVMSLKMACPFFVMSTVPKDKDPEAAEAAILEILEKGVATMTEADLDRAKSVLDNDFEDLFNNAESMAMALSESESCGSWKLLLARREQYKSVTLEAVRAFAAKYLRLENRTVGRFTPDPDAVGVQPDPEPDVKMYDELVAKLPATGKTVKEFAYTPAGIQAALKWISVGPVKIGLLKKETKGDKVYLQFFMPLAGRDAIFKAGLSGEALGSLMTERTASLSREELKTKLAQLNTEIGVGISGEGASISITTSKASMVEAMKLVVEMLRTPVIDESGLAQYVRRTKDQIKATKDDPMVIFQQEVPKLLFPEGDARRGRTFDERLAELDKLTVEGVLAFHKEFLGAEGMIGGVVGDVADEDLSTVLRPLVNEWVAARPGILEKNEGVEALRGPGARVETPGKPSAVSVLLQPLRLNLSAPDYPALDAAAWALFQDPLASRIPRQVRGEKALSYMTGGAVVADPIGNFGMVLMYSMTKPGNAEKALELIRSGLTEALKSGITEEELAAFKLAYPNRVSQMRADDGRVADAIVSLRLSGQDFTFWQVQDDAAAKLTLDEVNAALRKYVDPSKMGLVQVGDFAGKKKKKEKKEDKDE